MNLFIVVNDELRLCEIKDDLCQGDITDFKDLIGENTFKEVKSAGYWKIDKGAKQISFYGGLKPKDLDALGKVKNCGFYSPLIQGYRWLFSEDFEFDSMQFIDII